MHFKKIFMVIALSLMIGFLGCSKEEKKAEGPKQERITKNLVPPKSELKGQNFLVELTDLQVLTVVDAASKEIVETPTLRGNIKITNKSKDILDIQAVTLEYLDEGGKPIPYKSEEKIVKVSPFWKALQPDTIAEGSLDVTIPTKAIKEKSLKKIEVDLVYVPSPLKREILTLSEKVEQPLISIHGANQRGVILITAQGKRYPLFPYAADLPVVEGRLGVLSTSLFVVSQEARGAQGQLKVQQTWKKLEEKVSVPAQKYPETKPKGKNIRSS